MEPDDAKAADKPAFNVRITWACAGVRHEHRTMGTRAPTADRAVALVCAQLELARDQLASLDVYPHVAGSNDF